MSRLHVAAMAEGPGEAMFDALKNFLAEVGGAGPAPERSFDEADYRLAAAALLIHVANADGHVDDAERVRLQAIVEDRFALDHDTARRLIAAAEESEREAVDLYHFTATLKRALDEAGRHQVVELLWDMAYADGQVHELEEARSRLASLQAMRVEEAHAHSRDAHTKAHGAWTEWTRERKARRKRMQDMLKKLKSWRPPTSDLAELKAFMREELETALAHEALDSDPPKPTRAAARKHLVEALAQAERDVAHFERKVEEEESRVKRENEHLRALIASFGD